MISKKWKKKQKVNRNDLSMINYVRSSIPENIIMLHMLIIVQRVKIVFKHTNPLFYNLINEFKKLIGVPILVNNRPQFIRGEPIVCGHLMHLDVFMGKILTFSH